MYTAYDFLFFLMTCDDTLPFISNVGDFIDVSSISQAVLAYSVCELYSVQLCFL